MAEIFPYGGISPRNNLRKGSGIFTNDVLFCALKSYIVYLYEEKKIKRAPIFLILITFLKIIAL